MFNFSCWYYIWYWIHRLRLILFCILPFWSFGSIKILNNNENELIYLALRPNLIEIIEYLDEIFLSQFAILCTTNLSQLELKFRLTSLGNSCKMQEWKRLCRFPAIIQQSSWPNTRHQRFEALKRTPSLSFSPGSSGQFS